MRFRSRMLLAVALVTNLSAPATASALGAFQEVTDVGAVSRPTSATFDDLSASYKLSAAGDNIWGTRDAFGFAWRQARGDYALTARVALEGESSQPHRKAGLMFRQSLAPDSAYVDVVIHGDGLISLQYRIETGGPTREVQCAHEVPTGLKLTKRGDYVTLSIGTEGGIFQASGCSIKIALRGTFYAGLVVCAHDNNAIETAKFSHVSFGPPPERAEVRTSSIELLPLGSLDRKVIYHSTTRLESPSFTAAGNAICFRNDGELQRLELDGHSEPIRVAGEEALACEVTPSARMQWRLPKDAARGGKTWVPRLSPDGTLIAYLQGGSGGDKPALGDYLLKSIPLAGGESRELARLFGGPGTLGISPWSADGKQLVFVSREPE